MSAFSTHASFFVGPYPTGFKDGHFSTYGYDKFGQLISAIGKETNGTTLIDGGHFETVVGPACQPSLQLESALLPPEG